MPKTAWCSLVFSAVVSVAMTSGCDSAPNPDSPEAKQQIAKRQELVKAEEAKANALLQKKKGKNAPVMKSIKANINVGEPAAE